LNLRHRTAALTAAAALAASGLALAPAAQASAPSAAKAPAIATAATGTNSLAAVLTANGGGSFDQNWNDYDIVTRAVLAVLAAKPNSAVKVLTDGSVALTAFVPNDRAFQILVKSLTGKTLLREKSVFGAVASLGIPTVEAVLLYHVVPGATITSGQALKANGAMLQTALKGAKIGVMVHGGPMISLKDKDPDARNPRVILSQVDINKGNAQIAHGIDRVLRPINLPAKSKVS
jgi:uncharacterized surface protein with fasciclin (FAS1) repeats